MSVFTVKMGNLGSSLSSLLSAQLGSLSGGSNPRAVRVASFKCVINIFTKKKNQFNFRR